ncbi:MAG: MarR family transcriptional regulator [Chloroflexota bacterium]
MQVSNDLVDAEFAIMRRLSGLDINLQALAVASNIWRASQTFRLQLERSVLRDYKLSWSSFSTLFIVWVWGPIEMSAIAEHQAVSRPTITSTVGLLEKRGYVDRQFGGENGDRRVVLVRLTEVGQVLIEEVFPKFNQGEAAFVDGLTTEECETLATLLRKVVRANQPSD